MISASLALLPDPAGGIHSLTSCGEVLLHQVMCADKEGMHVIAECLAKDHKLNYDMLRPVVSVSHEF